MAKTHQHDDGMATFLRTVDGDILVSVLIELARDHKAVAQRLVQLQAADRPQLVAAAFRQKLEGWQRDPRYLQYPEAGVFGRALEIWLRQVERELLPTSPAAVLDLAESFIESDTAFFERADDSYGDIGRAMDSGCRLWLRAASSCQCPSEGWTPRLMKLLSGDDYGGRRELLQQAGQLLGQIELARLRSSMKVAT